jgi:hypothetical protein
VKERKDFLSVGKKGGTRNQPAYSNFKRAQDFRVYTGAFSRRVFRGKGVAAI